MRMTAIHAQAERKRQDRSARRAEKHRRRARTWLFRDLIRPVPAARPTRRRRSGQKILVQLSDSRDLHGKRHATWRLPVKIACDGVKLSWDEWHANHFMPYSKGGKTAVANGQAACPTCNLAKSNNS
jgi:5-methylcytosine-specific restriction endonuclease McrA